MKQIIQNYRTGELKMIEVPYPMGGKGLLVERRASIVSVGTEKAMIDVARKSLLGKALARPDWVKQVVDKVKTEGLRFNGGLETIKGEGGYACAYGIFLCRGCD